MRKSLLAAVTVAAVGLVACGDGPDGGAASGAQGEPLAKKIKGAPRPPEVKVPDAPPPRDLVVRELEKGWGAVARHGQRIGVNYVGFNYRTKEKFEEFWGETGPFYFGFGTGEVRDGWETGLKGMKVGGVRELILPSRLAYGTGPLLYVVELVEIQ